MKEEVLEVFGPKVFPQDTVATINTPAIRWLVVLLEVRQL